MGWDLSLALAAAPPYLSRMIKTLIVAARDRKRLAEIVQVASSFGLDALLARFGIERANDPSTAPADPQTLPARTRLALEALGPTFMKLG